MKTFIARFERSGYAIIEAEDEDEAYEIVSKYQLNDIDWSDNFNLVDEGIEEGEI